MKFSCVSAVESPTQNILEPFFMIFTFIIYSNFTRQNAEIKLTKIFSDTGSSLKIDHCHPCAPIYIHSIFAQCDVIDDQIYTQNVKYMVFDCNKNSFSPSSYSVLRTACYYVQCILHSVDDVQSHLNRKNVGYFNQNEYIYINIYA